MREELTKFDLVPEKDRSASLCIQITGRGEKELKNRVVSIKAHIVSFLICITERRKPVDFFNWFSISTRIISVITLSVCLR